MKLPSENGNFETAPEGNHLATCFGVVDLGSQETSFNGQSTGMKRKVRIMWELPDEKMESGKPFIVNKQYTLSSDKKATFRKDLEAWRGAPFSKEDFGNFEVGNLIGVNCLLNVVHNNDYANVASITPVPKSMGEKKRKPTNATVNFDLEDFDVAVYAKLSEKTRETIALSPEYRKAIGVADAKPVIADDLEDDISDLSNEVPF